jgi:hypothetical protein
VGPLLVRCLLFALTAEPIEANAAVATETRAGEMPLYANQASSSSFVATVITPEASLDYQRSSTTLRLRYFPRFYWQGSGSPDAMIDPLTGRTPAYAGPSGVITMHQAGLSLTTKLRSTTLLTAQAVAAYGTPDYAALPQLLPTAQAALPPVQPVFSATGTGALQADVSRRWQLLFATTVSRFQPVGKPDDVVNAVPIQTSTTVTAAPGFAFQATHLDFVGLTVGTTYVDLPAPPHLNPFTRRTLQEVDASIFIVTPTLTWRRRLARDSELRMGVGASHAENLGTKPVTDGQPTVVPTATAQLIGRLAATDQATLSADLRAGVDDYVDPILAVSGPRLLTSARLTFQTSTAWSASLQADFSTSWAPAPTTASLNMGTVAGQSAVTTNPPPDLTSVSVSLPVRYRVSSHLSIEAGGRYSDRRPSFSSPGGFHQQQLFGYVALTLTTRNEAPNFIRTQ